ncbi:Bcr/CflA family efflux MFS transporter [Puerhibacterium puerhi]|uniref:Bcr/CflA family efflux MFS transporter n=1 Tax=Puerhibacterium puerhi TaxID=2692623 RepID=UPI001915212E|nr:Bcr/CflA family efflux MFS transporter [Puerhibacterium puerhi]
MTDTLAPPASPRVAAPITPGLLVVLALLSALAPFATDLYLPAFPRMTVDLATDATQVQLTLTAFLVGVAAGQLVFGPLSDRWGRRGPLVVGAVLCVAASVVAALAPNVTVLVAARLVQGLTGAAGMVVGRAIISDLATGKAAARAFSVMMMVGGIAPILAPFVGSLLVGAVGWRGILWVVAALAAVMLASVLVVVRETLPAERRSRAAASASTASDARAAGSPVRALLSRAYLGHTLAFGFAFAVMMAYISASPFVYQVMIGMSAVAYGIVFGATALGLLVVSALSARLAATRPARRLLGVGLGLVLAGALALVVLVLTGAPAALLPVPIFVAVASLGLVLGNATALALAAVPRAAGTGSAVLGALQFALAALVSPLVGLGGERTAVPLAVVMVAAAVVALGAFLLARPRTAPAA